MKRVGSQLFYLGIILLGVMVGGVRELTLYGQTASELLERANTLSERGEFNEAEQLYFRLLREGGNEGIVYFNLANLYFRQERVGDAAVHYQKVIRVAPLFKNAYFNLGKLYYLSEDYPRALQTFKTCLAKTGVDYDVLILLGSTARVLRDYEAAIRYFEQAVAFKDTEVEAYVLISEIYRELSDLERAVEILAGAALIVSESRELDRVTGEILMEAGLYEAAASAFSAALVPGNISRSTRDDISDQANARDSLAQVKAVSEYDRYFISLQLVEAFEKAGLVNIAIFELKRTVLAFPDKHEASAYLEFLMLEAGRDEEAFEFFKELYQTNVELKQTFKNLLARAYNAENIELMKKILGFYKQIRLEDEYSVLVKHYLLQEY